NKRDLKEKSGFLGVFWFSDAVAPPSGLTATAPAAGEIANPSRALQREERKEQMK
ncbi:hypothetical protein A2U01_0043816, partial [Trifolium medium]|nr:hypothetical protein [Trifolium medium]